MRSLRGWINRGICLPGTEYGSGGPQSDTVNQAGRQRSRTQKSISALQSAGRIESCPAGRVLPNRNPDFPHAGVRTSQLFCSPFRGTPAREKRLFFCGFKSNGVHCCGMKFDNHRQVCRFAWRRSGSLALRQLVSVMTGSLDRGPLQGKGRPDFPGGPAEDITPFL